MNPVRSLAATLLPLAVLALVAGCEGCRKKPPSAASDDRPLRSQVAVHGVAPSWMDEGNPVEVTVSGEEFHDGASLSIGGYRADSVRVVDGGTARAMVPSALPPGEHDVKVTNADGSSGVLRSAFQVRPRGSAECSLETIHFAYDRAELDDRARAQLVATARCIQQRGFARVVIAGHADERGSTDYNLALGQRRADSVRRYLVDLGVAPGVLASLSFGEERPVDTGSHEGAWARNRRAEATAER